MARRKINLCKKALEKLGFRPGAFVPEKKRDIADSGAPLAGADEISRGVYRIEKTIPFGMRYGARALCDPRADTEHLKPWGASKDEAFLDLETTGLSSASYPFLAGVGICTDEGLKVAQIFLSSPAYERNFIEAIKEEIRAAQGFVTYNGRTFDVPMLRMRSVMTRIPPDWLDGPNLDLLPLARTLYKRKIGSCSLSNIENCVLGVKRSSGDIPGYMVPAIYAEYLETGKTSELAGVFYHNSMDIASMASLTAHLAELLRGERCTARDLLISGDAWKSRGCLERAESLWQRALDSDDCAPYAALRLAHEAKRRGDYSGARRYFSKSAECRDFELISLIGLAKLEEHQFKNLGQALAHSRRALELSRSYPYTEAECGEEEIRRRIDRLTRKIARTGYN
jgi:uncharacterized protein YprB with RNaseH-like and TPR domain